ncbi:CDAN1-interacting nuclease 1 [Onthophagus taurus]|uniref:CDAN1-interacting nuclease 1 n=1 Tax=Onthophagus taurus TaxID=166361 RepID=UPI000C1FE466|nr:uncharacterized protein C15orf41 homolog [Onthophagus taurus]
METEEYGEIMKTIKGFHGLTRNCLMVLTEKFPKIQKETLYSILSLEYQRHMKHRFEKSPSSINKMYDLYEKAITNGEDSGVIIRLSLENKIAPCLAAKLILLKKYEDVLNDESVLQTNVSQYLRDTSLIDDKVLAYEIFLCTLYDDQYSHIVEVMRTSVGQQYEIVINRKLRELGLAFRDEEWLRKLGYDKTPDFKLDIPIMIDGLVIHWIESKAVFGDVESHTEYIKNQYSSYWNRFGPGLVIYWFGYMKCITETTSKNLMIKDKIPENIQQLE